LGTEEWNNTYGGNNAEIAESVQQASDGGYIFTGLTESFGAGLFDLWIVKTDSAFNEEWDQTFGGYSNDIGYSVQQISEGEYVIAGCTSSYGVGGNDFWLIRLGQEVSIDENTAANSLISNLSNYPNPSRIGNEIKFNFRVGGLEGTARNVELKVYNILGELVAEVVNGERLVNNYTEIWRPDNLSNGVYFYQLKTENYREVKKMLITK